MSRFKLNRLRLLLAALAVAVGVVVAPAVSEALVPVAGGHLDFGGLIVWTQPCSETTLGTPAWYMVIVDLSDPWLPFPVVLTPASRLNMYFAPILDNMTLGAMFPVPGVCTISGYDYIPYEGYITPYPWPGLGTSLLPPVV